MRTLTYQTQVHILSQIAMIADRSNVIRDSMIQKGFAAFVPRQEFERSFCARCELEEHRLYEIEVAKSSIGAPDGLPGFILGKERGYRSPILAEMRRKRDTLNGKPSSELVGDEVWKREIDPCLRRLAQLEAEKCAVPIERRARLKSELLRCRVGEIDQHLTGFDPLGSYEKAFEQSLAKHSAALGFDRDALRSSRFFPVVSKQISEHYDLCWSLESKWLLEKLATRENARLKHPMILDLRLYVRPKNVGGPAIVPISFEESNLMLVQYQKLIAGFSWAYGTFVDLREMELNTIAHATLYSFVSDEIENILAENLTDSLS